MPRQGNILNISFSGFFAENFWDAEFSYIAILNIYFIGRSKMLSSAMRRVEKYG